jgi:hypothetical protein
VCNADYTLVGVSTDVELSGTTSEEGVVEHANVECDDYLLRLEYEGASYSAVLQSTHRADWAEEVILDAEEQPDLEEPAEDEEELPAEEEEDMIDEDAEVLLDENG